MRSRMWIVLVFGLVVAACGDDAGNPLDVTTTGGSPGTTGTTSTGGGGTTTTGGTTTVPEAPTTTAPAGPMLPVPIREGLASFDAYVFVTTIVSGGPGADETSETTIRSEYDRAADSRIVITDTLLTGPDYDEPETSRQRVRSIGNRTCTHDGDTWTYTEATAQEREILELAERQIDLVIVPESPVEVGREQVAGIPAIHYTFTPAGLGRESGAVTDVSVAEYWVSIDGNILLRYQMVAESRDGPRNDPETTIFTIEIRMELVDTIGPGEVSLPDACLENA